MHLVVGGLRAEGRETSAVYEQASARRCGIIARDEFQVRNSMTSETNV